MINFKVSYVFGRRVIQMHYTNSAVYLFIVSKMPSASQSCARVSATRVHCALPGNDLYLPVTVLLLSCGNGWTSKQEIQPQLVQFPRLCDPVVDDDMLIHVPMHFDKATSTTRTI
jgi:hypothetical protein